MTTKIKLKTVKGCGAPPEFRVKKNNFIPGRVKLSDVRDVAGQINAWIAQNWTGWLNWGWLLLVPYLVRFVKNDLLLRDPLRAYVQEASRTFQGAQWVYHRKVKTYGYGETSETVVKISILIVASELAIDPSAERKYSQQRQQTRQDETASSFQRRITVSSSSAGANPEAMAKVVTMDYVGGDADEETDGFVSQGFETADEGDRSVMTDDEMSAKSGEGSRKPSVPENLEI